MSKYTPEQLSKMAKHVLACIKAGDHKAMLLVQLIVMHTGMSSVEVVAQIEEQVI